MPETQTSNIRNARLADVPKIQRMVNDYADQGEMLHRPLTELYENLRDYWVCEDNGEVVGCVGLHVVWDNLAEVKSLAVVASAQGKGYGKELVQATIDDARRLGIPKMFALTFQPDFFARMGFSLIDKHDLPHKIWGDCIRCPKFPDCDEQAVSMDITPA